MTISGLVKFTYGISGVYFLSAGLMALGSPWQRVVLTLGMGLFWLALARLTDKGKLTLKSMVNLFLALAAIYLLTSVDYFMDELYAFAVMHALAFIASLGVALLVNYKWRRP